MGLSCEELRAEQAVDRRGRPSRRLPLSIVGSPVDNGNCVDTGHTQDARSSLRPQPRDSRSYECFFFLDLFGTVRHLLEEKWLYSRNAQISGSDNKQKLLTEKDLALKRSALASQLAFEVNFRYLKTQHKG